MQKILTFILFLGVFFFALFPPHDSDLGWHLRYGQYFFQNGHILEKNILSSEMPDYAWVNHSWGSDLLTYMIFAHSGFAGLSIIGSLLIVGTIFLIARAAKLQIWDMAILFPLLLYYMQPFLEVSFRSQLVSLFFISFLFSHLLSYTAQKRRQLFILWPLFFLWANMHGAFILGLFLFGLWAILYIFFQPNKWETATFLGCMLIGSVAATLINPYGLSLYAEVAKHAGNPVQKFIVEWLPFDTFSLLWWQLLVWSILVFTSIGITLVQKEGKAYAPAIIVSLILLFLSFFSRRYAWIFFPLSLALIKVLTEKIRPPQNLFATGITGSIILIFTVWAFFMAMWERPVFSFSWEIYCREYVGCSPASAAFLQEQKLQGAMITFYNWGGWLIWQYPTVKPSVDGRMTVWKSHEYSAFETYYALEQNVADINTSHYSIVYMSPAKPLYQRMKQLVQARTWDIIYEDQFAGVFLRK